MSDFNTLANLTYSTFATWTKINEELTYQDEANKKAVSNARIENYTGLLTGTKDIATVKENEATIHAWQQDSAKTYEQYRVNAEEFDFSNDMFSDEDIENSTILQNGYNEYLLAVGHMNSADLNGDQLLNFNEYVLEELNTSDYSAPYLKEGITLEQLNKAAKNGEDITQYIDDNYIKFAQQLFQQIDYPQENTDGLSIEELADFYYYLDSIDGNQDSKISIDSLGEMPRESEENILEEISSNIEAFATAFQQVFGTN